MHRHIRARKRSAKTNYKRRIALLKSGLPRIVVRRSNRRILVQAISYDRKGDMVLASAESRELAKLGWPSRANIPTAYLTGLLLAKKGKGIVKGEAVLDVGLYKPVSSSVVFAGAKGVSDGGIKLLNNIEFDEKRLSGGHISEYAKAGSKGVQFSRYSKDKIDISSIGALFESVKKKVLE